VLLYSFFDNFTLKGKVRMSPRAAFSGGFGGNIGHDPHLLYTLSAVQVLALFDKLDVLDINKVTDCILWNEVS